MNAQQLKNMHNGKLLIKPKKATRTNKYPVKEKLQHIENTMGLTTKQKQDYCVRNKLPINAVAQFEREKFNGQIGEVCD